MNIETKKKRRTFCDTRELKKMETMISLSSWYNETSMQKNQPGLSCRLTCIYITLVGKGEQKIVSHNKKSIASDNKLLVKNSELFKMGRVTGLKKKTDASTQTLLQVKKKSTGLIENEYYFRKKRHRNLFRKQKLSILYHTYKL